jgi:hypothetical protein
VGRQTKLTRRWAKRGTRPSAPKDQRRSSAWIFGAICPAEGKGAGIVIWKKSPSTSRRARTLSCCSIRRGGMVRLN